MAVSLGTQKYAITLILGITRNASFSTCMLLGNTLDHFLQGRRATAVCRHKNGYFKYSRDIHFTICVHVVKVSP